MTRNSTEDAERAARAWLGKAFSEAGINPMGADQEAVALAALRYAAVELVEAKASEAELLRVARQEIDDWMTSAIAAEADRARLIEGLRVFAEAAESFRPDDSDTMRPACVQAVHYRQAASLYLEMKDK